MAKLTSLKPRLGGMPSRFASAAPREIKEQARLREREQTVDYRGWYKIKRWADLREQVLIRDGYTCRKTGKLLTGKHPAPDSPVVDHIKPHNGDPALFWDPENLQSVCKAWHDSVKQAMEHAGKVAAIHPKWLRPSAVPLTIVCGAPASGKTTYVKDHAGPQDLVIDLDQIVADLSGGPLHGWDRKRWLNAALYRRNDMLGSLSEPGAYPAAWFIVSEPKAEHRAWWRTTIKPSRIVAMETPEAECIRRAALDPDRDQKQTADAIVQWWFQYGRRQGEEVIRWQG